MTPALSVEPLGPADRVVLEGEVDMAVAPELEAEALRRTRASRAVVVDLSRVSYLDSAGARLVDSLVGECVRRGRPVRVVAPPGSAARATLALCEFPADRMDATLAEASALLEAALA